MHRQELMVEYGRRTPSVMARLAADLRADKFAVPKAVNLPHLLQEVREVLPPTFHESISLLDLVNTPTFDELS